MSEKENNNEDKNKKAIEDLIKFLGMLFDPSKRNTNDDRLLQKVQRLIEQEDWDGLKDIPGNTFVENIVENKDVVITIINYNIEGSAVRFTKKTIYKKSHESYIRLVGLEKKLKQAVDKEDWENAVKLRDEIAKFREENTLDETELEKVRSQMMAPPTSTP